MIRYKKLMVGLSLDESDTLLIQYAGFISKLAKSSDIYFVHVTDSFDIPSEIKKVYPQIVSLDEAAEKQMRERVEKDFNGHDAAHLHYEVIEGPLLGTLISFSKERDIDLMIVGQYTKQASSDTYLAEKLARKSFCSVLILPDTAHAELDSVLVTLDFSKHAVNCLDIGSAFAKASGLDSIYLLNTYKIPEGYYKTGKSKEEFSQVMLDNAKAKLRACISSSDLKGLKIKPFFQKSDDVVEGIRQFAKENNPSLIVVGARGRSGDISAILLGSVTEGLIRTLHKPLLAVKKKGEGLNILETLFSS